MSTSTPMLRVHVPHTTGNELTEIGRLIQEHNFSSNQQVHRECLDILSGMTGTRQMLLTSSCTHALEMAVLLLDLQSGDEVIMPSFTFSSTANAVVLRGAIPVFVDNHPATMNMDPATLAGALTDRTRAIIVVHYAGIACDMERIAAFAAEHGLAVIEDAAQCIDAYHGKAHLGTIGDFGAISFHHTKNIHCGKGGLLIVKDKNAFQRAQMLLFHGTNRLQFIAGEVPFYDWQDIGSSYALPGINAAFLLAQLRQIKAVQARRDHLWRRYYSALESLPLSAEISLPAIPAYASHNSHIFFIKCQDRRHRDSLMEHLTTRGIQTSFHYIPLHSAPGGNRYCRFSGHDNYTTLTSETLLRLPLHTFMSDTEVNNVVRCIESYLYIH